MVELKGSLTGIGLMPIVQLIGEVHHTGNLDLRKGQQHGALAFEDGHLVAAVFGEHQGLQAVADCVLELSDGEFTFVEAEPTLERTLDLGPAELKKLMDRIASGEFQLLANGANGTDAPELRPETTCPLLGFADDRARHYSRPTALHRCYAGGAPSLVSAQEQRDLCLSGRFATCPRYRSADQAQPAGSVLAPEPTVPTLRAIPAPPPARPPEIPAGVAARLAAASQMHVADETPVAQPRPVPVVETEPELVTRRPSRGFVLVLGAAALGFVLVGVLMLLVLPALHVGQSTPSSPVGAPEPVAKPTAALAPTAAPVVPTLARASQPTLAPPPTTSVRVPTVTPPPRPTPAPTVGRALLDVRFAAGPAENWLNNPPYAAWSDGAYRFQAHDATHFVAVGVPIDQVMSDVVVSATFRKTGGPPGGGYGLIVRDQGPEPRDGVNQQMTAYVLETGDLGEYGIWRRDGDHWVDLVPWTRSTAVRSGGSPNDLAVRATGDALTFTVNGADVATIHDDVLVAGGVGLFVGGDYNEVALDHFSVQIPN